jgi:hypothetical protein
MEKNIEGFFRLYEEILIANVTTLIKELLENLAHHEFDRVV